MFVEFVKLLVSGVLLHVDRSYCRGRLSSAHPEHQLLSTVDEDEAGDVEMMGLPEDSDEWDDEDERKLASAVDDERAPASVSAIQRAAQQGTALFEPIGWKESLSYAVPAALYVIDNNVHFVALEHIDPTTYYLFSNVKVILTALLFQAVLKHRISRRQWACLVLLISGVIVVQQDVRLESLLHSGRAGAHSKQEETTQTASSAAHEVLLGLCFVSVTATSSSLANVWSEYMYKNRPKSVHEVNMRLYVFGVLFNAIALAVQSGPELTKNGIFHGFSPLVVFIIFLSSCGGLSVSFLLKWADNIVYMFAQAGALLTTMAVSAVMLDFRPTPLFFCGIVIVCTSAFLYRSLSGDAGQQEARRRAVEEVQ